MRSTETGLSIPENTGFAIFPPETFPEAREIVARAQAALADLGPSALQGAGKDFFAPILDPATLTPDHPLVRLALRGDVVGAVSRYLDCVPLITDLMVRWSPPFEREAYTRSQLFHCDGDDVRQVKIFVLCSDVGPENGPLELMDAAASALVRRRLRYQYRSRLSDGQVREVVGGEFALTPVLGPAGTVCLVDTSRCFHFGSRVDASAEGRLIANVQYLTPWSFVVPRNPRRAAPFARLAAPEGDALDRLLLGAD